MTSKGTLVIRVLGDDAGLTKTFDNVTQQANGFGSKMDQLGGRLTSAGRSMSLGITLPIVGIGVAAVNTAMDYETSMNVLQASSDATAEQMKKMADLAIQLGNDMTLPGTSAADAGEAMTELAKAGLSVNDVMAASKGVLQLSAAGNLSNAQAAEVAANALNSFNLEGSEASRVADLLAAAANSSSAEVVDMADGLKMSAAVFSSAGFEIDELTTAMGLMANAGIKGSDAGTSLKQAILALATPTGQQKDLMAQMGFAAYDSAGNMKSLREIVDELGTSTAGMTQEQRDFTIATIFGSDAVRAINVLLAEGVDGYDAMNAKVNEGGAAADLAAARNKGLAGAIDALKSTAETFLLTAAVPMLDNLNGMIQKLAGAVTWFGNLSPGVQQATFVFLGLLAALGPLLSVAGNVIKVVQGISAAMTFLAANPVVLAIAGVAALVAGVVYAYQNFESFRNFVDRLVDGFGRMIGWVRQNWPTLLAVLTGPFGLAAKFIYDNWNPIASFFEDLPRRVGNAIRNIGSAISEPFRMAFNAVATAWNNTVGRLSFSVPSWVPLGFGGRGWDVPDIPYFDQGGVMPGQRGVHSLAWVAAGETILPTHKSGFGGGRTVNVTINAPNYVGSRDELVSALTQWVRSNGPIPGLS